MLYICVSFHYFSIAGEIGIILLGCSVTLIIKKCNEEKKRTTKFHTTFKIFDNFAPKGKETKSTKVKILGIRLHNKQNKHGIIIYYWEQSASLFYRDGTQKNNNLRVHGAQVTPFSWLTSTFIDGQKTHFTGHCNNSRKEWRDGIKIKHVNYACKCNAKFQIHK